MKPKTLSFWQQCNKSLLPFALITSASAVTFNTHAAEQAVGLTFNNSGLGITYSRTLDFSWREGDQFQLRGSISGLHDDDVDDTEISDIDYEIDIESVGANIGIDWYPFNGKYSSAIFFAGGISYFDYDIRARSEIDQAFRVGGQLVVPADNVTLTTDIEQNSVAPYLSVGWGNRLSESRRWYFQAELGISAPFSDADVRVSANDPNGVLSASDMEAERRQIDDDVNGVSAFGSVGLSYRF